MPLGARHEAAEAGPETGRNHEPIGARSGDLGNPATDPAIALGPATSHGRAKAAIAVCAPATENWHKTFPAASGIAINGRPGGLLNAMTSETLCAKMQATIGTATNGGSPIA